MDQSRADLARRQADLVAALVRGDTVPDGFDEARVRATADALLRKRAGEVGARWPTLRAQFGPRWTSVFSEWARGRAPHGAWRDGWDFARYLAARGDLDPAAAVDLASAEATYVYDGEQVPRRRRWPALRRHRHGLVVQIAGRLYSWPVRGFAEFRHR